MVDFRYKQAVLHKENPGKNCLIQHSWIPIKFAVEGSYVDLQEGVTWNKGWKVHKVYPVIQTHEQIIERGQDYKRTRKASDI